MTMEPPILFQLPQPTRRCEAMVLFVLSDPNLPFGQLRMRHSAEFSSAHEASLALCQNLGPGKPKEPPKRTQLSSVKILHLLFLVLS